MDFASALYSDFDIGIFYASTTEMCTTTSTALHPKIGYVLNQPDTCPVNGFGGSWYDQPFEVVPVYNRGAPGVVDQISWAKIDEWATIVSNVWVTTGTCFGLCLAALAYVIALTPNKKRGKPFHTTLLLALVAEIGRLLCNLTRASNVGLSRYSAYLGLTSDYDATTYSPAFQGLTITSMIFACLALFFTYLCLYIQTNGLLTGLRLHYRAVFWAFMIYLIIMSLVTLGLRVTATAIQTKALLRPGSVGEAVSHTYFNVREATSIASAISLGSWCMVSLCSVFWLMFTRTKLIVSNRHYDTALTILSLVFMESFVVPCKAPFSFPTCQPHHDNLELTRPVVFIILQAFPQSGLRLAELVVLPSILVLLPMGSLFMTIHTAELKSAPSRAIDISTAISAATGPQNTPTRASVPELAAESSHTNTHARSLAKSPSAPGNESYPLTTFTSRTPLASNAVERELQAIDNMDNEVEPVYGQADVDRVFSYRARKIRSNLRAKGVGAGDMV